MHTIDVIGTHPDTTPSAVAKELMLTLGTVTTSLNKLEKKGYIVRTRSSVDRRVVHLSLSKKGRLVSVSYTHLIFVQYHFFSQHVFNDGIFCNVETLFFVYLKEIKYLFLFDFCDFHSYYYIKMLEW